MKINEKDLILACRKDLKHFKYFFEMFYGRIYNYILRRILDPAISRDLCADTFYNAMRAIGQYKWQGKSLLNWLYTIASNQVKQYFRNPHNHFVSLDENPGLQDAYLHNKDLQQELFQAEAELQRHQEFLTLSRCIQKLPEKSQQVLSLRYFEELSLNDIAEILTTNLNSTKTLLYRSQELLKNEIKSETFFPSKALKE